MCERFIAWKRLFLLERAVQPRMSMSWKEYWRFGVLSSRHPRLPLIRASAWDSLNLRHATKDPRIPNRVLRYSPLEFRGSSCVLFRVSASSSSKNGGCGVSLERFAICSLQTTSSEAYSRLVFSWLLSRTFWLQWKYETCGHTFKISLARVPVSSQDSWLAVCKQFLGDDRIHLQANLGYTTIYPIMIPRIYLSAEVIKTSAVFESAM